MTFQWGPKSVITFPSGGQQLPGHGFYQITGLAWSGGGAVRKVEVSTDGGQTWKDAEIRGPVHPMAHTRFGLDWKWDGQECVLQSRCTDELGQVQPSRARTRQILQCDAGLLQDARHRKAPTTPFNRGEWPAMGASTMRSLKFLLPVIDPGVQPRRVGAVAHLWLGKDSYRGRDPRLGHHHQSGREANSRREEEAPRKARSSSRRSARHATEQPDRVVWLPC